MNIQQHLFGSIFFSALLLVGCNNNNSHTDTATQNNSNSEAPSSLPSDAPTYNVATVINFSPFSYSDENGNLQGYDVDLIKAIGEEAGFKVNIAANSWDQWTQTLDDGFVDIWMGGIAASKEREDIVSFSQPYLNYSTAVLTRDDAEGRQINRDNLKNYRIAAQSGTVDLEYAKSLHPDEPEKAVDVKTNYLGVKAVVDNNADALISNDKVLRYYYTDLLDQANLRIFVLDDEQDPDKQLGFAVKKGNTELAEQINKGLEGIKQNGTYNKINEKWFGVES